MNDPEFLADSEVLNSVLAPFLSDPGAAGLESLPKDLPKRGIGSPAALEQLAPAVLGGACHLGDPLAFAHMDPPTPWVTWVTGMWNASVNQNLLHPDVAPLARDIEARVIRWLAPLYGMDGGHMTPGSTVSNLTALWAARELKGVRRVLASSGAHLSVAKSAHLLGLEFEALPTQANGALDPAVVPENLSDVALVLTAGATSTGAIDPLTLSAHAAWTHVDAAWSGPIRLSERYSGVLDGIEAADSISISAHKWFFQPKESALVFFRNTGAAHPAISFGDAYLATPNVGVLGSHGAAAVPLMATLMALGRDGIVERIDRGMGLVETLHDALARDARTEVFGPPQSGVLLWRPNKGTPTALRTALPEGMSSLTSIAGTDWLRQVAANPMADIDGIHAAIDTALNAKF